MNRNGIRFTKICEAHGAVYFFALGVNGLFELNTDTGEARLLASVPGEYPFEEALYRDMQYFENKIYGIPFQAFGLAIYDLTSEIMKVVEIEYLRDTKEKFISSFVYNRKLYMIPFKGNSIWTFDIDTGKAACISNLTRYKDVILKKAVVLGDEAYLISYNYNFIFRFNLISTEKEYWFAGQKKAGFRDLIYFENRLWLLPIMGGSIFAFDIEKMKFQKYEIIKNENVPCFSTMMTIGNLIFLLPSRASQFAEFDIYSGRVELLELKNEYKKESGLNFSYGFSCRGKNFGLSNKNKSLVLLDETQKEIPICFCNPGDIKVTSKDIEGHLMKERSFFTLENYLSVIPDAEKHTMIVPSDNIGLKIHQIIDWNMPFK